MEVTRRKMLRMSAVAMGGAALAACGATPTVTPVPPTQTPVKVIQTQVVVQTQVVEKQVTSVVEKQVTQVVEKVVTPTPAPTPTKIAAKITGVFTVVQKKDFFQSFNDWLRGQMADFFTKQGWSWDIAYEAGYTGGTGFVDKLTAMSAAGTPPDLMMHTDAMQDLMRLKVVDPVDDVVDAVSKAWGSPSGRQKLDFVNITDKKWYYVPYFQRSDGGWYRDPAFKAKGIDLQTVRLYPDLWEACLAATQPDKQYYGWGVTISRNGDGDWFRERCVTGWGAAYQDETGQYATVDTPQMADAITAMTNLYMDKKWANMLPPGVLAWTDTGNNDNWFAGKLMYTQNGGTLYGNTYLQKLEPILTEMRFHPPAGGPVIKEFNSFTADYWALFRGSKNQDAARATMQQFLIPLASQEAVFTNSPVFSLPAYANLWDASQVIKTQPVALQQKPVATSPNPLIPGYSPGPAQNAALAACLSASYMADAISAILKGTAVKAALAEAQTKFVKTFKDMGLPGSK
jgi:multiple sugar transport system substrate-binding protein